MVSKEEKKAKRIERRKKTKENLKGRKVGLSEKAKKALDKALKAGKRPRTSKTWHTVKFRRPKTLIHKRTPKYPKSSVSKSKEMDKFAILKTPLTTETAIKMIEEQNTIGFIVDIKADKKGIKEAFEKMYDTKVHAVRTSIMASTGQKKAFLKMPQDVEAVDVANKVGIC